MALRGLEPDSIEVSARTGEGFDALLAEIARRLPEPDIMIEVLVPYDRGDLVSRLHIGSRIISLEYAPEGTQIVAFVKPELAAELRQFKVARG
jgi:GTP-binding protein HflX